MKNTTIGTLIICVFILLIFCDSKRYYIPYNASVEVEMEIEEEIEMEDIHLMFDYLIVNSVDDLLPYTTDVIRAIVLDKRVDKIDISIPLEFTPLEFQDIPGIDDPYYEVYTIYRLKVLDVFKGATNIDDIIEIAIIGGQFENLNVIVSSATYLTIGDDLILFMNESIVVEGRFFKSTMTQSIYRFVEPELNSLARGVDIPFESVNERNQLTLTLSDLEEIAEANAQTEQYSILFSETYSNEEFDESESEYVLHEYPEEEYEESDHSKEDESLEDTNPEDISEEETNIED